MNRDKINWSWFFLLVVAMAGCDSVLTVEPVVLDVDTPLQEKLEGKWEGEDSIIDLSFSKDGQGLVTMMDDGKMEKADLLAVKKGERIFLSFRPHESDENEKFWFFGVCQFKTPDELDFFFPRVEELEKQIGAGKLTGEIEKGKHSSTLRILDTPQLVALIESDPEKYLEEGESGLARVK